MTQEDKQLLLKDLCARLPYGVKFTFTNGNGNIRVAKGVDLIVTDEGDWEYAVTAKGIEPIEIKCIKPYLRPMSSMTDEERLYFYRNSARVPILVDEKKIITKPFYGYTIHLLDYLNAHHLDYQCLIEKGLALEAPNDMYKTE